ncbi:S8 family serine peptidase [Streptomyces sp. 6N223]|uniref:S8 family serine peptidase n=1 Tax=Streptomyces sp. 6N223 TaxID=3457412 RepID=UPI003FD137C0
MAATTVAMAAALTAAATAPTVAQETQPGADAAREAGAGARQVTLITGDKVVLDGQGEVTGLIRASGRERIPVQVLESEGATYVVPRDAQQLIADGTVDRRLFDVTELSREQYDAANGVPVIVTYDEEADAADTRAGLFADEGAENAAPEVTGAFSSINGEALTVAADDAAATWEAFTQPRRGRTAAAPGVATITLDAVVQATLADSVPQIGAPQAWDAGFDGTGTTIAIVDTGITPDHENVSGKVVAEQNFTTAPGTGDRYGHGTHVASIAAGTGAHSGGDYTGVAPGADLINAKVLGNDGYGETSWVLAGMEWAVEQGADVINMSLGDYDTTEIDPLEEAINTLSAETDSLFVVAAGNDGPAPGTIGSPGSADAALTVGAVDKQDQIADFSSVGPRLGDGAVKPDVTAPGVDIGAAASPGSIIAEEGAPVAEGYVAISGTSMATPHTAGAAAILAQAHPEWGGEEIKGALTGSTQPNEELTAHQQGTGRIDVPAALDQTVIAEPTSLNFGLAEWPHGDDEPVTRELTYRNLGETDVTLDLAATATNPQGNPAPEGTFTLGADQVTVPAGGTATVDVTADTTVPSSDGSFSLAITATGAEGGQTVRTVGAVEREVESYDLTVEGIDRDGDAPTDDEWYATAFNVETFELHDLGPGGTTRLPAGEYVLDASFFTTSADGEETLGIDWLVHPDLSLTEDTTVTVDARDAAPIDVTVAGVDAVADLNLSFDTYTEETGYGIAFFAGVLPEGMHTAQIGGVREGWTTNSSVSAAWQQEGTNREYHAADLNEGAFYTGLTKNVKRSQLARVTTGLGASLEDREGALMVWDGLSGMASATYEPVPRTDQVFVEAASTEWALDFFQSGPDAGDEAYYFGDLTAYEPGKRYRETYNVGVFGPQVSEQDGALFREGNTIYGWISPFADGAGHGGDSLYDMSTASTTLYRDGEEFATAEDVIDWVEFEVPADEATYELVTTVGREGMAANVTTQVTASYTFTSAAPAEGETAVLPAAAVRYAPELALDSTSPAGETVSVPVTVQASEYADAPTVAVEVSYDGGETWEDAPVDGGAVEVTNPAAGGSVSFRATVEDGNGNATTQTIIDAYHTA